MHTLTLDTTTPASMAYLFHKQDEVILQHGGVATRLHFSSLESKSIEAFVKEDVPKLGKPDDLYVIRDTCGNRVSLIYADQVFKYNLTDIEDVALAELAKLMQPKENRAFYPGFRHPLVGYVTGESGTIITVAIPSTRRTYNVEPNHGGMEPFSDLLWLPPVWFQVTLSKAKALWSCRMCVVLEHNKDAKDSELFQWPLANVHGNGSVCLGTAYLRDGVSSDTTEGELVDAAEQLVFSSNWNTDLLPNVQDVDEVYETLPKLPQYEDILDKYGMDRSICMYVRTMRVLREPTGYARLMYTPFARSAEDFLEGRV